MDLGKLNVRHCLNAVGLLLLSMGLLANCTKAIASVSAVADGCADYLVMYKSDWNAGIDARIRRQAANADAISVVFKQEFGGAAVRTTMSRSDDFKGIANGAPRAELAFAPLTEFSNGGDYEVRWSTMIPAAYMPDRLQPEIITQIHQSGQSGSPPFSLMLAGSRYRVDVRGRYSARIFNFGDTQFDEGRVVHWVLRYQPDDSGTGSRTDLYKDGKLVVRAGATENAYPNEREAYLKIGLYKWNWMGRPSEVSTRTMYYGDVEVRSRCIAQ